MSSVGKAQLTIVPKFDNLGSSIEKALNDTSGNASKVGRSVGESYSGGFAKGSSGLLKSGALIGVFSSVTNQAMSLISSSVDGAVSRLDTLNNYPKVMESLGYSAESSQSSITKMSERLSGLPTALNDMTSVVQGISAITNDLDLATNAGLALNDMLLASGSGTAVASSAMEQFRQMLSKGTPEMQDWKALTSAMPGQMKQLAEAMLGTGASANDLYYALGGGKAEATHTMDQLLQKMIELDTTSTESFTSFEEQARSATGGVATSMQTMQTAVERGIASILDSIGTDTISETASGIGKAFESGLTVIGEVAGDAIPYVQTFISVIEQIAPVAIPAAAGVAGLAAAGKGLGSLASIVGGTSSIFTTLKGISSSASESLLTLATSMKSGSKASEGLFKASGLLSSAMGGPLVVGIAGAAAVSGLLVSAFLEAKKKSDTFREATTGLSDAISRAASLDDYAGKIDNVGSISRKTAMSVDELAEATAERANKMNEMATAAESEIAQLNSAQQIINEYTGATDLSSDAQGRLEWALGLVNEQLGLTLSAADVANGAYTDTEGHVVNLRDKIYQLIEAKKLEIKTTVLSDSLTSAYEAQSEASDSYAAALIRATEAQEKLNDYDGPKNTDWGNLQLAVTEANKELEEAERILNNDTESVNRLESELGDVTRSVSDAADAYDEWGNTVGSMPAILEAGGNSLNDLKNDLRELGADTEVLASLEKSQLEEIALAYDGTMSSIIPLLQELGVINEETANAAAQSAENAKEIQDALLIMGSGATEALGDIDITAFSKKLADAGVSAETLKEIGSENFAELSRRCNGDIDALIEGLVFYNSVPLIDKDGNVNIEDSKLVDAQGNIYSWNEGILYDKNGVAAVDDTSLTDSQGNVWIWNGTGLESKDSKVVVTGNVADGTAETKILDANVSINSLNDKDTRVQVNGNYVDAGISIWDLGHSIKNLAGKTIDVIANIVTGGTTKNAAGGIRLNAAGGYRYHAGGAIATKATPLDIVGEDGAEAIVPLTNKKYSLPFAKTLAEQMGASGNVVYNIYLDGWQLNEETQVKTWTVEKLIDVVRKGQK